MANKFIIDVSSYNGVVDWSGLKKAGISGAILKIIRKDLKKDNQFDNNYNGVNKEKLPWGVYNYSYATTESKAKSDMNLICDVLDKCDKTHFKYGIWFDTEDKVQEALPNDKLASIINAAQSVVESRGYTFGVYTGMSFFNSKINTSKVKCKNWWIARYYMGYTPFKIGQEPKPTYKPTKPSDMCAWQFTSSCDVKRYANGNSGSADMNLLYHDPVRIEKTEDKAMTVKVGSARIDENGRVSGGKAGDQTGREVSIQNWYLHSKGWTVIRAKTASMREKIAKDMEYACANSNIGYDQSQNNTLWNVVKPLGFDCSKVKTKCETDCARLVRVCCWYAGSKPADFYTGTEAVALKATGDFDVLTSDKYCKSSDYLMRGDILVTRTKGHTVVVLNNGAKVKTSDSNKSSAKAKKSYSGSFPKLPPRGYFKTGDGNKVLTEYKDQIKKIQVFLNWVNDNAKLVVDGAYGAKTTAAVKAFQEKVGITADGQFGKNTLAKARTFKK